MTVYALYKPIIILPCCIIHLCWKATQLANYTKIKIKIILWVWVIYQRFYNKKRSKYFSVKTWNATIKKRKKSLFHICGSKGLAGGWKGAIDRCRIADDDVLLRHAICPISCPQVSIHRHLLYMHCSILLATLPHRTPSRIPTSFSSLRYVLWSIFQFTKFHQ